MDWILSERGRPCARYINELSFLVGRRSVVTSAIAIILIGAAENLKALSIDWFIEPEEQLQEAIVNHGRIQHLSILDKSHHLDVLCSIKG